MKTPALVLVAVLVGAGVLNNVNALTNGERPPESWVTDKAPTKVGSFDLQPETPGSKISYKMNESTYEELDPIGIAAQRYNGPGGQGYDAVIVCGNNMESFHDQRWCFKAQGWDLLEEKDAATVTKTYGRIPVKLVKIGRANTSPSYAVFTFRGPSGFHADVPSLSKDFFKYELFKQKKFIGSQYRFIPGWNGATPEEVLKFAAEYIDEAAKSGKGEI